MPGHPKSWSTFVCKAFIGLLLCFIAGCGTIDVSSQPQYWGGWEPGHEYEILRPFALVETRYSDTEALFELASGSAGMPVGSDAGTTAGYKTVVVRNVEPGTVVRVTKILFDGKFFEAGAGAIGTLLSGPYSGVPIHLGSLSHSEKLNNNVFISRRDSELARPLEHAK